MAFAVVASPGATAQPPAPRSPAPRPPAPRPPAPQTPTAIGPGARRGDASSNGGGVPRPPGAACTAAPAALAAQDAVFAPLAAAGFALDKAAAALGHGAFGQVLLAKRRDGTKVVVKVVDPEIRPSDTSRATMERLILAEEAACQKLMRVPRHANVLTPEAVLRGPGGRLFIVMEYVQGPHLLDYLRGTTAPGHVGLPTRDADCRRTLEYQLASAVAHCLQHGIIHGDLKAENTMLRRVGDRWVPVLFDFGLGATFETARDVASVTTNSGSGAYAAPEVWAGTPHDAIRAEMWSLGVLIYVIEREELPFDPRDKRRLRRLIAAAPTTVAPVAAQPHHPFSRFIARLLNADPDKRMLPHEVLDDPWFNTVTTV